MAKKEKPKKPDAPPADAPAEGEEGGAVKKKMAGKTLVLFIILPAVLVLGGGGAAAMMLMGGGGAAATEAHAEEGDHPAPEDGHGEEAAGDHGGAAAEDHGGGGDHAATGGEAEGETEVGHRLPCEGGQACYYAMPKMVVNLAGTEGQRSPYMELELSLEAANGSVFNRIPELMPRLKDQLNAFLRELRVEDLNGSAGTFTLRRELLKRFNLVLDPKKIDAVLIEGMLIQ
jgi:flagellar FliL protein